MNFKLYDSFTRKKQPMLKPDADQTRVRIYACGPTVYQRIHIGNARPFVVFGMFARYLRARGFDVTYVCNITDVNDKIYAAAREQGVPSSELAATAAQWYIDDTDRLGIGRPDVEPRATESIQEIVDLIQDLVDRGLAYPADGDVYFRVEKYSDYGRLSNQQIDEMLEHGRVEPGDGKERPLDFALWKGVKDGEDTAWDSPWGRGRPGWHIECSAMAEKYLGPGFDIHGGGLDLIFPHHENEIAQSRGAGRPFGRLWMHNGMLTLGDEKMSKSEGNIATLSDVLDEFPAWVVLLYFYGASYRNPLAFSQAALEETRSSGHRITESLRRADRFLGTVETRDAGDPGFVNSARNWEGIHEALEDDFNTANAMSEVFGLVYDLNTAVNERATPQIVRDLRATLQEFLEMFCLQDLIPQSVELSEEARRLLDERELARSKKDFQRSDELRDELAALGYLVRDTPDGVDVVQTDS